MSDPDRPIGTLTVFESPPACGAPGQAVSGLAEFTLPKNSKITKGRDKAEEASG